MRRLGRMERVSSLTEGVFGKLDRTGKGRERARVIAAWRAVAGVEVFAHARGFALRDQELVVFVDSPIWANELAVLSERYRTAINEHLGKETVGSIRFAVSRKVVAQRRVEAEDAAADAERVHEIVQPVGATSLEREQIRQMAAVVKDDGLRQAVIAAAIAHLEWKKGTEAKIEAQNATERVTGPSPTPQP